ncbi:MAG: helix-turn-helix domain-containing protein [Clostridium sp.]|nr:helix-turn-helix domain-containing protein [Clostridium sp.]
MTFLFAMLLACAGARANSMRELTMRDGLADLTINVVYKDAQGYIYFGTDISVDRFDGERIRRFPLPGSNEVARRVQAVTAGPDGAIYAGNGDGLWRLEEDGFEKVAEKTVQYAVNSMLTEGDSMFVATNNGLYIMSGGAFKHILPGNASVVSNTNHILGLCLSADKKTLWGTTVGGVLTIDLPSGKVKKMLDIGHPGRLYKKIARDGDKIYVSARAEGIFIFDPSKGEFSPFRDWGNYDVTALSSDGRGTLRVGINGEGVRFVDAGSGEDIAAYASSLGGSNRLRSNSVYSLLVEESGQMWVGYYQVGVDYSVLSRSLFDIYAPPGVLDTENLAVRSLSIEDGLKLIGTRDGLYAVDENKKSCTVFGKSAIGSGMVFAIKKHKGEYYIGTGAGLYVYNRSTNSLRPFLHDNRQLRSSIQAFSEDGLGRLWVGSASGVACIEDGKVAYAFDDTNSQLPNRIVYEIFFDSAGTGWICTEQGVAIFDGKNVRSKGFRLADGKFNHEKIRSVYEDSRHNLFFLPDRGLPLRTNLQLSEYEFVKNAGITGPLPSSINPMFVIEDADSLLWIGSSDGLVCTDLQNRYSHFTRFDGLPSLSFTLCKPVRDDKGNLWLGNTRGLVRLDRDKFLTMRQELNPVKVTEVRANGKILVNGGKPIENLGIRNGEKSLQVLFSDFSFTSPEYQSFEYRLSPKMAEDEWERVHGESEIYLYGLDNGDYTLHIRHMGDPASEATLPIHVANYGEILSAPVIALGVLAIALIACLLYGWRKLRMLREAAGEKETDDKYKAANINTDNCRRLQRRLEKLMADKQPYLDPKLKISDLAQMLDSTPVAMSHLFNQYLDTNYYDYVNSYRIRHFCKMAEEGGDSRYTLTAMSEKCGFSSRASFFRSFGKSMGVSPGEYIRRLHEKEG